MRCIIVRCEDTAPGQSLTSLIEGAKLPHLQQLAQSGAAGTLRAKEMDRLRLHGALLGIEPTDPAMAPARWYAANAHHVLGPGETAWCCEFLTQQDGQILTPFACAITGKESASLIQALNEHLGSEARRWVLGAGGHHLLVTREASLIPPTSEGWRSPELLTGQPWRRHLPKGSLGETVSTLIDAASKLLDAHPVNRVRVDLGENPANLIWLWGASPSGTPRSAQERTGRAGTVVSSAFPMRGLAQALGLGWAEGLTAWHEAAFQRLAATIKELGRTQEVIYVHLRIDQTEPVDRLCAMERLDQLVLKELAQWLPARGPWRLLTVIDERPNHPIALVAAGSDLPAQPVARLSTDTLDASPLLFKDGQAVWTWLTKE